MKRLVKVFLFVAVFAAVCSMAQAGSYGQTGHSIYLDGKVQVRFDQLMLAWSRDGNVDRIKYAITCLKGKAVLNNVEYLDKAVEGKETVRWTEAGKDMGVDFSSKFSHLDKQHRITISKTNKMSIKPMDLDTAKVCFHIAASGRNYKVFWMPKKGNVYAIW